jgi:hypothetical protein
LTNTRVTYAGAGGLLKDSASITTDGTTLTAAFSGAHNGTVGATTPTTGAFTTLTATNFNAASTFGFKNRIINGNMVIDQRNAGASVTPTADTYTLDRWSSGMSQASKMTIQQSSTVPSGFSKSLSVTVASAYTPSASEWFGFFQKIEGFNSADFGFGAAGASTVTISFWVRSSITGSYGFSLSNASQNRSYPVLYTVNSANTWEQKTITIAGDTSGTWVGGTNGIGLVCSWSLGAGSTYQQTANAWGTGLGLGTTGQTNWITNAGATFYITGVQLEVGSSATGFEYVDYTTQLCMCQRYYYKMVTGTNSSYANFGAGVIASTTLADRGFTPLPVNMRASPSFAYTTMRIYDGATAVAVSSISANYSTPMIGGWGLDCSGAVFVIGRAGILIEGGANTGNIQFSSEL